MRETQIWFDKLIWFDFPNQIPLQVHTHSLQWQTTELSAYATSFCTQVTPIS